LSGLARFSEELAKSVSASHVSDNAVNKALRDSRQHRWAEAVMVRFVWEYGECEQAAVTS
jgi:hypothetical protein